ncbi:hypothetical protein [uncultured Nostoc sp.]|uniref:hypothetical protein n=1 Tax=uncultured Nostoc sp. TaxID=340711 RepID=UPI0035CA98C4
MPTVTIILRRRIVPKARVISIGLTHELRNNEPQRRREASALGGFPDLKQLARHGEIRV